jgi:hypothetical protein
LGQLLLHGLIVTPDGLRPLGLGIRITTFKIEILANAPRELGWEKSTRQPAYMT